MGSWPLGTFFRTWLLGVNGRIRIEINAVPALKETDAGFGSMYLVVR
jgi:hypothetical protein